MDGWWIEEYYVCTDMDVGGPQVRYVPVSGPHATAEEAEAALERAPDAGAYCARVRRPAREGG